MKAVNLLGLISLTAFIGACGGSGGPTGSGVSSASSTSSTNSSSSESSSSVSSSSSSSSSTDNVSFCERMNRVVGFASMDEGTTGGAGGNSVTVTTGAQFAQALADKTSEPLTIFINGTITPENSPGNKFEIKDMNDVSVIGVGDNALLDGIGIKIWRANNIIIRNLTIRYVNIGDKDGISIEGPASNIWIDHNEIYNTLDSDKDFYDELVSGKRGVDNVTISYNFLHDSWKTSLWGSSDTDEHHRRVTFYANHWLNAESRMPLYRFGEAHVLNNLYQNITSTAVNSRMGASILVEGTVFENAKNPIVSFYSEEIGFWDVNDNIFENINWSPSPSDGVIAGPDVAATISYTPPYTYEAMPSSEVKEHVMAHAGVDKIGECLPSASD
ncbi:MAG TPA: pectate lyase [Cellvibrionaceae bacterium]